MLDQTNQHDLSGEVVTGFAGTITIVVMGGGSVDWCSLEAGILRFPPRVPDLLETGFRLETFCPHPDLHGWICFNMSRQANGHLHLLVDPEVGDYSAAAHDCGLVLFRKRCYRAVASRRWGELAKPLSEVV